MPIGGLFLIALFSGALFAGTCPAEGIIGRGRSIEGFGKLTWGVSVGQAEKAYPDLHFGAYEIENRKEEPVVVFYRSARPEKIDGVVFDSVEYVFKGGGFYKVRASLSVEGRAANIDHTSGSVLESNGGISAAEIWRAEGTQDRLCDGISGGCKRDALGNRGRIHPFELQGAGRGKMKIS